MQYTQGAAARLGAPHRSGAPLHDPAAPIAVIGYTGRKGLSEDPRWGKVAAVRLLVTLERDESGMIVAECPSIPGCISQGGTEDEALANIREAIQACVEARAANGIPITVAIREVEVAV